MLSKQQLAFCLKSSVIHLQVFPPHPWYRQQNSIGQCRKTSVCSAALPWGQFSKIKTELLLFSGCSLVAPTAFAGDNSHHE